MFAISICFIDRMSVLNDWSNAFLQPDCVVMKKLLMIISNHSMHAIGHLEFEWSPYALQNVEANVSEADYLVT